MGHANPHCRKRWPRAHTGLEAPERCARSQAVCYATERRDGLGNRAGGHRARGCRGTCRLGKRARHGPGGSGTGGPTRSRSGGSPLPLRRPRVRTDESGRINRIQQELCGGIDATGQRPRGDLRIVRRPRRSLRLRAGTRGAHRREGFRIGRRKGCDRVRDGRGGTPGT